MEYGLLAQQARNLAFAHQGQGQTGYVKYTRIACLPGCGSQAMVDQPYRNDN